MTAIDDFDYTIIHFLNQFARRSALADALAYDIADASILKGGIFMAYLWWLWYSANERNAVHRESIVLVVIGGFVAAVLSRVLQLALPFHDRPLHTAGLGFVLPYGVEPQTLEFWSSFPSDHAVLFGALSTGIYFLSARVGLVAWAWTLHRDQPAAYLSRIPFPERRDRRRHLWLGRHARDERLVGKIQTIGPNCAASHHASRTILLRRIRRHLRDRGVALRRTPSCPRLPANSQILGVVGLRCLNRAATN